MKKLRFWVATIFPKIVECYAQYGIVAKAVKKGALEVEALDLRRFADNPRQVDDEPYGGGPGMVLKPEPIFRAYREVLKKTGKKPFVVATEPWGERITQRTFEELKEKEEVFVICGRYEGIDERVKSIVDKELSLGDFILSGGELAALVLIDGTARLLEGVLSDPESLKEDSFSKPWLGYPVYTRPFEFEGKKVPEILTSGDHKKIDLWRLYERIKQTLKKRPDLVPPEEKLGKLERELLKMAREEKSFEEVLKELQRKKLLKNL